MTVSALPAAELIAGRVVHERTRPTQHRFSYGVFCLRIDIERLEEAARAANGWFAVNPTGAARWLRPFSLQTRDYGPRGDGDLAHWARHLAAAAGVDLAPGRSRIELQTFPRMFGFVFNPVSFWLCRDESNALKCVIAEVNNTFGERHIYVLRATDAGPITASTTLQCAKVMHVSPFCEVRGRYQFRVIDGARARRVDVDYYVDDALLIATRIAGQALPFDGATLRKKLFEHPFMTLGVVARIHLQALWLWKKRVPWFSKPTKVGAPITGMTTHDDTREGS